MTPDELERHPSSKVWTEPTQAKDPKAPRYLEIVNPEPSHMFFLIGDDGKRRKVMWTEDGRIVDVDEFLDYM